MSSLTSRPALRAWRSVAELEGSTVPSEVPPPPVTSPVDENEVSRRGFLQLMGASMAFAGAAGCHWDEDKIAPLARRPEGVLPGVPLHYSTASERGGVATPLRVTAYDGRPIKVETNPDHPYGGAGTNTFDQASVLEVYDPDRSRKYVHDRRDAKRDDFVQFAKALDHATRLCVLCEATSSPTVARLRGMLAEAYPALRWVEYEPLSGDNEREGTRLAFGAPMRPLLRLAAARTILALDGDLLVDHPAGVRHAREYARGRRPEDGPMNRLYAVESTFSHTGAAADHRLPLRSELVLPFTMALYAKIRGGDAPEAGFLDDEKVKRFLTALAEDLKETGAGALVTAGARQPREVHALVAAINDALGAVGHTVDYVADADPERPAHTAAIAGLAEQMGAKQVDALLILGGNPVYDGPASLDLRRMMRKVPTTIHLGHYEDETSAACSWHLPRAHAFESWGDARTWDGTVTLQQPLIEPLNGGMTTIEVLAALLGLEATGEALVRETFAANHPDADWRRSLHDGWVEGSAAPIASPSLQAMPAIELTDRQKGGIHPVGGGCEVVFVASSHTYDGRHANNGWLHETPNFATKLTWDNAALVSPQTARDLGIANEDLLRLTHAGGETLIPAYVMPGQAPYSITLAVGHGRTRAGVVGGSSAMHVEPVGFDTYPLRSLESPWLGTGVVVHKTGAKHPLATTQDHWAIDELGQRATAERLEELVRSATQIELADPHFGQQEHELPLESLFAPHEELTERTKGHRWGMATDLSTCIGCNACMVACQSENNVPIVGKEQVRRNREMHWIRIDRYFSGDIADPQVEQQPVACQHCENAPCEQVCPVGATVHSNEGLNEMVYNRCVGTRYCLNNCPYKVRRFNFFDWHGEEGQPIESFDDPRNAPRRLMYNPEVTVRSRGVMEKCSFCSQRIEKARISARNENRELVDGEIQTACMQACPTQAIVFGDLSDPDSRVRKLHDAHENKRGYALLADLNTKPRNVYLTKIRNPNPSLTGSTEE